MEEGNNLWKTEFSLNETIYVNLFASGPKTIIHSQIQVQAKDNHESTKLRKKGNDEYQLENWSKAMQFYNQSLCFAEIGTENVALAYSNRSACFHSLKFYNESIDDIEFAKNAGIPERLIPKLEQRKQECQKLMNIVERPTKHEIKLDFEANKNIPSLADVLEIRRNKEYGRHVIAKYDIPAGKTILVENVFLLASEKRQVCYTCFKENRNFIACPQCTEVLYCNTDCMDDNLTHGWECGTFFQYIRKEDDEVDETIRRTYLQMKFQIQAILFAISIFPNVEDLMQFVENTVSEDVSSSVLKISSDLKSSYHMFLTLFTMNLAGREHFCKQIFDMAMALPKVNALFDSKKKQRFLMHLILHHYLIIASNSSAGNSEVMHFNIYSLLNHSCAPNVDFVYEDARRFVKYCVTVRPVRKGEQLCTHYLSSSDIVEMSKEKRREHLKRSHRFICKCEKCEKSYKSTPEVAKSYARFQQDNFGADDRRMIESCVKFLNKHKRSPWSVEIENISSYYQELLDGLSSPL